MALKHFAKLGLNGEVLAVNGLGDNVAPTEKRGIQYLTDITGWAIWRETSESGDRKNFAGIGDKFDEDKNAFIRPKPYPSWILNEDTCLWEAPVAQTENAKDKWNEETTSWE
jgi:hypothetical protein|tara:strand:- start:49 stop:384 length:336 start_codon:yes stop_codon:yes gene_type:complete